MKLSELSLRTRTLNCFRNIFKVAALERLLLAAVVDQRADALASKFVPNPYQYPRPTWRKFDRSGVVMKVDISDYIGHLVYFGFYEPGFARLLSMCRGSMNVIDVGANIGWTALNLARQTSGKVIGFEPDPINFERCQENVSFNRSANLTVLPIGLGKESKQVMMEVRSPENRGGNRITARGGVGYTSVDVVPLDQVGLVDALSSIDLIKIDVEGYEMEVLAGAVRVLSKFKPALFVEVDNNNLVDQGSSARQLVIFLESRGYICTNAVSNGLVKSSDNFENCHFDMVATSPLSGRSESYSSEHRVEETN